MGALDGKTAIVTGGATGIGRAIAERFAAEGAEVILAGRRKDRLEEAVSSIGARARAVPTDVSDDEDVRRLVDSVDQIDLLVTCAGGAHFGSVTDVPVQTWRELFAGRFFGQLSACHFAVPKMPEGSAIILCSGVAGHIGLPSYAGGAALCGAVNAMGRSLAVELAPKNIRVNVISPGLIGGTAIRSNHTKEEQRAWLKDLLVNRIPLGRPGQPQDLSDAALFLATCPYVTGQVLDIDGGWVAA